VKADELILAARALMVEKKGLSLPKWIIFRKILSSVRLFPALLKTGSLLQGLLLKKIPRESGLRLRFSLPYLDKERFIPSLAHPFFLNRHPKGIEEESQKGRGKVGLFVGCSINYLFPEIGESTVRLLERHSLSAGFPQDQGCCGLPAYGSGDLEAARTLARRNVEVFRSLNASQILVPCASCFYFLKEGYPKLFPDDEEVRSFSERIVEPSTFFLGQMPANPQAAGSPGQDQKMRLTYHDPCHLRRSMKIFQEPRQLLKSLPRVEFVEMKQPDRCCGMGGSFNFIYYDLSKKIMERKLDDIEGTKADAVTTSCMGCMIQLKDGIHSRKMRTKVLHLVEVIERSLDGREMVHRKGAEDAKK
jgi:glycolate oxidase iron-sulfur subunit